MANEMFKLQELLVEDEASFAVNAASMGTNTYTTRLPIIEATATLEWSRGDDQTAQNRKNVSRAGYLMVQSCAIEFTVPVPGALVDPGAGTPTASWFHTLLGDGLGGKLAGDDGGTIASATDAGTFVTTAVTALTPGAIIRVGVKHDARGDGQPGIVGTWSAGATQLLGALPGTPAAADAVRPTLVQYPTETEPTVTKRFLLMHKTTGAYYQIVGAQLESVTFDYPIASGAPVRATFRYMGAAWAMTAASSPASLPSSIALPLCDQSPIAGGSFAIGNVTASSGVYTEARAIESPASMSLTLRMGLLPRTGPVAGQYSYANIYGWTSMGCVPTLTYTIPWDATKYTEWQLDGSSTQHKFFLFASNGTVARCSGFALPKMFPVGQPPTRTEMNGQVFMSCTYQGSDSDITTSELTRSAVRFWQG